MRRGRSGIARIGPAAGRRPPAESAYDRRARRRGTAKQERQAGYGHCDRSGSRRGYPMTDGRTTRRSRREGFESVMPCARKAYRHAIGTFPKVGVRIRFLRSFLIRNGAAEKVFASNAMLGYYPKIRRPLWGAGAQRPARLVAAQKLGDRQAAPGCVQRIAGSPVDARSALRATRLFMDSQRFPDPVP